MIPGEVYGEAAGVDLGEVLQLVGYFGHAELYAITYEDVHAEELAAIHQLYKCLQDALIDGVGADDELFYLSALADDVGNEGECVEAV